MFRPNSRTQRALLALTFLLAMMMTARVARADSLGLAWDANPEPEILGYYVFIGTAPGVYSTVIDVGNTTSYTFASALPGRTYYVSVAAYVAGSVAGPQAPELVTTIGGGPTLSNPGNRTSPRGVAVTLNLSATDPDGEAITFGALGLPVGLTLDPTTGAITGIPTTAGVFSVSVTASDPSAHVTTQSFTWTIVASDTVAPAISITSPTSAATFAAIDSFVTLSGTATDDVGVTSVTWVNSRGGSGTAAGTASWSVVIPLQSGTNVLTMTARDASNKATTDVLTVLVDLAPTVIITAPTAAATYTSGAATMSIGGTAADDAQINRVTWSNSRGGSGTAVGTATWAVPVVALQTGINVLTVTAFDATGHSSTDTLSVTLAGPALQVTGLTANKTSPQNAGTAIVFTATATGGTAPYQYKWRVFNGSAWSVAQDWSSNATFAWTPMVASSAYQVEVWARSAGSTTDAAENTGAAATRPFTINASSTPLVLRTLTANRTAPQPVGTTVTFSATAAGGTAPYQYKWFVFDGAAWTVLQDWAGSSTYAWTPTSANAAFRVRVWVRSAGSALDASDNSNSNGGLNFPITGATAPLAVTGLSSDKASPQTLPTSVNFTAAATGGTAPYSFKFRVFDGTSWGVARDWSTVPTFAWTPTVANAGYRVEVWARSSGSSTDAAENAGALATRAFVISDPAPVAPLRLTSVAADRTAPQTVGTTVTFTAAAADGTAPYQYKWLLFNGATTSVLQNWSASNTVAWTPTAANNAYRVDVWVRNAGSTTDAPANGTSSGSVAFPIASAVPALTLTSVTSDRPSPQLVGTPIVVTAAASGGTAPYSYKWRVFNGSSWAVMQNWSTTASFVWTPTVANDAYQVEVWARSSGSSTDAAENAGAAATRAFVINDPAPVVPLRLTSVAADRTAPQTVGTTVTFTAAAADGTAPYQYKWLLFNGATTSVLQNWSASNTVAWTPTAANNAYRIDVWVRNAGSTTDAPANGTSSGSVAFPIASAVPALTLTSVTSDRPSPQLVGTPIVVTAAASGGTAPYSYKWRVFNGSSWAVMQNWSTTASFVWTPTVANGAYQVEVWARSSGSSTDAAENGAAATRAFAINNPAPVVPLRLTSLTADKVAPQAVGTTITFTARATDGKAPYQYKWLIFDGYTWTIPQNWSASNTLVWTPSASNQVYRVGVWVRDAGSTIDASANDNANGSIPFPIANAAATLAITSVAIERPSPQPVSTPIGFAAAAAGGTGPYSYKWRVFNGTSWTVMQNWSANALFVWTPMAAGNYQIEVWARSAGKTADAPENAASDVIRNYAVTYTPASPLRLVALTPDKGAVVSVGTPVTVTTTISGGVPEYQYKWWLFNGSSWTMLTGWSSAATYTWTPSVIGQNYRLGVWVRSSTNSLDMSDNDNSNGSIQFMVQ